MLITLVTYNSSVTDIHIEVIADINLKLHILYLEESIVHDIHNNNYRHFCYAFCSSAYVELSIEAKI